MSRVIWDLLTQTKLQERKDLAIWKISTKRGCTSQLALKEGHYERGSRQALESTSKITLLKPCSFARIKAHLIAYASISGALLLYFFVAARIKLPSQSLTITEIYENEECKAASQFSFIYPVSGAVHLGSWEMQRWVEGNNLVINICK